MYGGWNKYMEIITDKLTSLFLQSELDYEANFFCLSARHPQHS